MGSRRLIFVFESIQAGLAGWSERREVKGPVGLKTNKNVGFCRPGEGGWPMMDFVLRGRSQFHGGALEDTRPPKDFPQDTCRQTTKPVILRGVWKALVVACGLESVDMVTRATQ